MSAARTRVVGLGLLLPLLAVAFWMSLQPGGPRGVLVRWFGPPRVELSEAHAPDLASQVFDHSAFDGLLREFVDDDGLVDYEGLGGRRDDLDRYVESLAAARFVELGRDEKLALLINAYNAFTLELILEHYPLDSIRDIPSAQRWDAVRWDLGGHLYSLNQLEHEQIRPKFREPRIHFALVCAAIGCPPLRREAYAGVRVNDQLEDQARRVHHDERWVRYRPGSDRIELTSLYEWYRGDFEQVADSVVDYVSTFREDLRDGDRPSVRFLDYDWSLNRQNDDDGA
jgi:hypothetical protein